MGKNPTLQLPKDVIGSEEKISRTRAVAKFKNWGGPQVLKFPLHFLFEFDMHTMWTDVVAQNETDVVPGEVVELDA